MAQEKNAQKEEKEAIPQAESENVKRTDA